MKNFKGARGGGGGVIWIKGLKSVQLMDVFFLDPNQGRGLLIHHTSTGGIKISFLSKGPWRCGCRNMLLKNCYHNSGLEVLTHMVVRESSIE